MSTKSQNDDKNSPLEGWQPQVDGVDTITKQQFPSAANARANQQEELESYKQKSLFPFWNLPKNKHLESNAKKLRKAGVLSEVIFWQTFKNKKLLGFDIDRQIIIGEYIVDFFVAELGFVVEIDGESHDFKGNYDQERDSYLKNLGLEVLRYKDIEIKKSINYVSDSFQLSIQNRVKELKQNPPRQSATATPQKGNFPVLSTPKLK